MLRYVFDTIGQLSRHVHSRNGSALLFFPNPSQMRRTGDNLMLEIQLRDYEQRMVLRAQVHSRVEGRISGVWLQFSDQLSRTLETGAESIRRRRQPRVGSEVMVEVRQQDASARIARMTDVSAGGARLGSAPGLRVGMQVELHLVSAPREVHKAIGRAEVVRAGAGEVGLRFSPEAAARAGTLVQSLEAEWKSAVTIRHPPDCCGASEPVEPPLPHARPQRAIH